MTAGDSVEPELRPGDIGDAVLHLQTRLQALGYFSGLPDGQFDEATLLAVAALATYAGLGEAGQVDAQWWAALAAAEHAAGVVPAAGDQTWQWDGERWQYAGADGSEAGAGAETATVDATGQWVWDGTTWQPVR